MTTKTIPPVFWDPIWELEARVLSCIVGSGCARDVGDLYRLCRGLQSVSSLVPQSRGESFGVDCRLPARAVC